MVNKRFLLGILVMMLVFGMTVVGCDDETPDEVTVTFDANGGKWNDNSTTKTAKVKYNTTGSELNVYVQNPTRQGYMFQEWTPYPNPDPNTVYGFNIIKNQTVYAHWKQN